MLHLRIETLWGHRGKSGGDLNQWIHGLFGRSSILVLSGTRLAFAIQDEKSTLIWPWVSKSGFRALRLVN